MKTKEEKFKGLKLPGIPMFVFNVLLFFAAIYLFILAGTEVSEGFIILTVIGGVLLIFTAGLFFAGFMQIEPNEARVLTFFGKYVGTVKENGLFWVNPLFAKKRLTLRARNFDAEPIKVNDKSGNPIMIGQVIVWKVVDTYKASFEVDNTSKAVAISGSVSIGRDNVQDKMKAYEHFVKVQSDAALRFVAGMYAYDNTESHHEALTLRSGGDEMNEILEKQLNERCMLAGIEALEARINYLAYAPEIAAVMLRRQQADAIISAREKIVEGAVGMVKLALQRLSDDNVVDLDDDKKAAMVTNLMVVLCSDEPAQPIINSGTLHH